MSRSSGNAKIIRILLICMIAIAAVIYLGWRYGMRRPSSFPVTDFWTEAEAVAQKWHADAYVLGIHANGRFDSQLNWVDASRSSVTFFFVSPSEDHAGLSVHCDNVNRCGSGTRSWSPDRSYTGCEPIEPVDLELDVQEALELALPHAEAYRALESEREVDGWLGRYDADQYWESPVNTGCIGNLYWHVLVRAFPEESGAAVLIDVAAGEVVKASP